ncbi:MAG: hypothetical protein QOF15_1061 [Mycobacterium sp.]|jgi:hypothetical protein|nr:hypothetical protein [Mycobacterium sp.]
MLESGPATGITPANPRQVVPERFRATTTRPRGSVLICYPLRFASIRLQGLYLIEAIP